MAAKVASTRTKQPKSPESSALFTHTATRGARTVVTLYGFGNEEHDGVTVVAEVWPVYATDEAEPQRQFHVFPTPERARQFAEDTLTALEYVGCSISTP